MSRHAVEARDWAYPRSGLTLRRPPVLSDCVNWPLICTLALCPIMLPCQSTIAAMYRLIQSRSLTVRNPLVMDWFGVSWVSMNWTQHGACWHDAYHISCTQFPFGQKFDSLGKSIWWTGLCTGRFAIGMPRPHMDLHPDTPCAICRHRSSRFCWSDDSWDVDPSSWAACDYSISHWAHIGPKHLLGSLIDLPPCPRACTQTIRALQIWWKSVGSTLANGHG